MQDIIINLGCISNAFPCIGFQGENEHRRIVFDAGEVYADYPDAVVTMAIKPPVGEVYPKIVTRDGNNVIWSVTAADVAYPDNGAYQLTFTNGTEIIKTYVGVYSVAASIIGNGQPPKPVEDWLKEAQAMLDAFAEMTAEATTLQPGSDATVELTEKDEHKVFLFGLPRGNTGNGIASCVLNADYTLTITFTDGNEYTTPSIRGAKGEPGADGEDGFSPVVAVSEITGGHRVVITDAQGDHTFDVLNGEDGFSPVVVITTITGGHRVTVTDASGSTSFDVMDGVDGTNGTSAYVWIRYAAAQPTQDSDMKTTPDAWMGVYSGSASSAPTHYTDYAWYNIKGATGEVSQAELDAVESELKSQIDELKPLGLIGDKYVYTASSGYQNVAISLSAGKYKCKNTSSTTATFRDGNNTSITGLSIPHTTGSNYASLTITSEQASEIAYIRLYQGYVEIFPEDSILDDINDINVELTKKADKPIKYTKVPITIESGYRKKNGTTYSSGQHFEVTVGSGVVSYKISGQHANSDYPFICAYDQSNNETFVYSGTAGAVSDYVFVPPAGTTHFYVNANNNGKCASGEDVDILTYFEDTETSLYQLRQDRESRYNLDKKNPFAWKTFDKAYFSWMNDDGRSDMYLYKDLCDDYNIPYANSMPWEVIDANTTVVDGMTVVNYCKQIITDGGEIFTHANNPLTSSSTEADIMQYFRDGKKIIEDAVGCKVSGIIQAGGSGYSTFDYNEGQRFCLAYYEYSDAYGTTPQYTLARTRIARSSYDSDDAQIAAFKAVVDDAIANHKWVRFYCHGTSEVSITVLTSVFDYIATKVSNGDCAWTSWKNMYDTFRSSSLENRIKALE